MKRFLFYLLVLTPLCVYADLPPTGYYRIQNAKTDSYLLIVDINSATGSSDIASGNADIEAIHMVDGFEENVAYNPATICYLQAYGELYDITGQGLDLNEMTGRLFNIEEVNAPTYQIYAKVSNGMFTVTRYLTHPTDRYGKSLYPGLDGSNKNWRILSVDQSSSQYFGVKPDVTAGEYHWATMYAGFPFKTSSSDTKIFVVDKIDDDYGCAVIKEVTNVPAQTPVLFRCASASPSDNKLTLLAPDTESSAGTNYLKGNYYCNDVDDAGALYPHRNVTPFNANNMRMLGVDANGNPAFVKGSADNLVVSVVDGKWYLPANKCYLPVGNNAPDVLKILTWEEYVTGIEEVTTSTSESKKVIYDLQGRRVQTPAKGLYIVNGKKVVIK